MVRIKFFNLFLYTYVVLNKDFKIYWSEQSFTGLVQEDLCSSWGLEYFYNVHCEKLEARQYDSLKCI
jgi:hypothetical protein